MTPIIALPAQISPKHGTAYMNHEYCDTIIAAGGLPIILPLTVDRETLRRYADLCHGLLLTGGLVEAICAPGRKFFHAVQWHPEKITDIASEKLFAAFVASCR